MKEIKDIEFKYPELRLITEQHKVKYFNAFNKSREKEQIKENCDLVINDIIKDIRFTGDKFILVMIMNNYMLEGANELLKFFSSR